MHVRDDSENVRILVAFSFNAIPLTHRDLNSTFCIFSISKSFYTWAKVNTVEAKTDIKKKYPKFKLLLTGIPRCQKAL